MIDVCTEYGDEFDIIFNADKSTCLYFESRKFILASVPCLVMGNKRLEYKGSHKILGTYINCMGFDHDDISRETGGIYARANALIRNFSACTFEVKRRLFISYCTNIYCASLWSRFTIRQLQTVKVAYNNAFRRFFKVPVRSSVSAAYVNLFVPSFDMLMRKSVYSLEQRLARSSNCILNTLFHGDFSHTNELRVRWNAVLRL